MRLLTVHDNVFMVSRRTSVLIRLKTASFFSFLCWFFPQYEVMALAYSCLKVFLSVLPLPCYSALLNIFFFLIFLRTSMRWLKPAGTRCFQSLSCNCNIHIPSSKKKGNPESAQFSLKFVPITTTEKRPCSHSLKIRH